MMKFGNLNIREGITKKIGALALAGSMAVTMCGCGSEKELQPTVKVPTSATIEGTLDTISDLTTMDDLLKEDKFVNKSDGKEYTFNELLNLYNEARQKEDLSECNTLLYKIGRMIMKSQLAEALYIKPGQITSLDINVKAGYISNIKITYKNCTRVFCLEGEMADLAINIQHACNHALDFLDVDNVYESFVEHLLTEATITRDGVFHTNYTMFAGLSKEKVDAFNAYNNGTRSSSSKYSYNYSGEDRGLSLCKAIREQKQEQSLNMTTKALGSYQAKRLHR